MKRLIFKRSVLNVAVMIWLLLGLIFFVEHGSSWTEGSGDGLKTAFSWVGIGIVALVIDIVLQYWITKRSLLNIIEVIIVCLFIIGLRQMLIQ